LRKTFGHEGKQVTRNTRKTRGVALYPLDKYSEAKLKRTKWTEQVTSRGRTEMRTGFWKGNLKVRNYWQILCRWEGYVKMDLKENGKEEAGWINLTQFGNKRQLLVNRVMHLRVTYNVGNCSTGSRNISFLKRTLLHGVN